MSLSHRSLSSWVGSSGIGAASDSVRPGRRLLGRMASVGGVAPHRSYWPGFCLRQQVTVLSVWLHSAWVSAKLPPCPEALVDAHPDARRARPTARQAGRRSWSRPTARACCMTTLQVPGHTAKIVLPTGPVAKGAPPLLCQPEDWLGGVTSAPGRVRTDDPRFTKPVLLPTELQGRVLCTAGAAECRPQESNPVLPFFRRARGPPTPGRHTDCDCGVPPAGIEPAASRFGAVRSVPLSYGGENGDPGRT